MHIQVLRATKRGWVIQLVSRDACNGAASGFGTARIADAFVPVGFQRCRISRLCVGGLVLRGHGVSVVLRRCCGGGVCCGVFLFVFRGGVSGIFFLVVVLW